MKRCMQKRGKAVRLRLDKNVAANDALVESQELERAVKKSLDLLARGTQEMSEKIEIPRVMASEPSPKYQALLPKKAYRAKPACKVPSAGTRDSARELKKSKEKLKRVASFVRKVKKTRSAR